MTDRDRLQRIFDEASGALPNDAGALLNLIRDIEAEEAEPFKVSVHKDGQIYISDHEGTPVLHALIKGPRHVSIQVGTTNIIEVDKMYGPLVFMPIRVRMDFDECEWIIERGNGGASWREVARFPGQLPGDFVA